ncbi:laminin subunit gamma-1-like [Euwallacea fornicatus]|uniref:laminin subunit gamma-1-like n=1 Tax=Euwallacea fornicatus TaxID=995702 RepID=UPI00338FC886
MQHYNFKKILIFLVFVQFEKCRGQLVHEIDHTPVIGLQRAPCYDSFNRPQRCIPEFENAAFAMDIDATNTCGEEGEQEYCVQTGITGIRKSCAICYPGQHHARYMADLHNVDNPTWWQSQTMLEGIQWPSQVNLTIRFGKTFDITYIRLWFMSPRPESFYISKKISPDSPWTPYQYYSATCRDTYGLPDQTSTTKGDETRALCTSEYSDISPLRGGNVAFSTLEGRPSAYTFDASPELQEWVTATELRITLDRINTFGDEVFGDQQVLKSYFYAIADVAIGARCKCNGHASECVSSTGDGGVRTRVCRCEHNTAGPDCGECLPFFNDAPWARATAISANECKQCNCNGYSSRCVFDSKLYEQSGHGGYCLDCSANRDGPNCERCRPNYYMRDDGYCIPCQCDETGSLFQQCNAEGKCQCKPGVTGNKCDTCAENHYEFSKSGCKSCECAEEGSEFNVPHCNPTNGECVCKENVEGKQCRECKPSFFNLDLENEFGCTPCFCYGHSSQCRSAQGYSKYALESSFAKGSEKWRAEDQYGKNVPIKYETISQSIGVKSQDEEVVYFLTPHRFLGDQRGSYNQLLEFSFRIGDNRLFQTAADIIIEGGGNRITNTIFGQSNLNPTIESQPYKFRLHEHPDFQWQPRLNSRDFISILTNLTAIKIRGTYSTKGVGFLDDVKLQTAAPGAAGVPALWMEFCECPQGYIGQFCESCAAGYRHSPAHGGPFTNCIPCDCNKHAEICDSETGRCICQHNTAGENCEFCARGYYGNALAGTPEDCLPCNCPNGGACIQLQDDLVMCTECPIGYSGFRCDVCSDGYYGDPTGVFGPKSPCQVCECNQNIDTNGIGNCNTTTGECLRCIHNTGGSTCEVCLPGYYGNALVLPKGDCKRCECNPIGTISDSNGEPICDSSTGACVCKPNVKGRNCDQCEEGYYNLQGGDGCQSCNCDTIGSFNHTCDLYNGQCYCRLGVTGLRCDHCEARKYGFSLEGCKECECDGVGSKDLQCDSSGQCPCLDNVEGRRCDRCKENKYDRHRGCVDCPECYNLVQNDYRAHSNKLEKLNEIINEIERRPTVITDSDFRTELEKLDDDIDELYDKVKTATGEESIIHQVQDIKKREEDVARTLESVNENIDGIRAKTDEAKTINHNTDMVLEQLDQSLEDIRSQFESDAKKALVDAWERSKQVGQQSETMTKVAKEARELADALDRQADRLVSDAKDAKNKSSEVYELAKKANSDQSLVKEKIGKLKHDLDGAEDKLNKTSQFTNDVHAKANQVKNEALDLLNEVMNLNVPTVDVPDLAKKSQSLKEEARRLGDKAENLLSQSKELKAMVDSRYEEGKQLVEKASDQQTALAELVDEIHEANETVSKTIEEWTNKLNEAERIYTDLLSSDSDTQKSRQEAEDALKTIPDIEAIISNTLNKADQAQMQLQEVGRIANESLASTLTAKSRGERASNDLKKFLEQASKLNEDTNDFLISEADIGRRIEASEDKLDTLLKHPLCNSSLVDQAKDNVGKAVQETDKVSDQVAKLLDDVQEIISELDNTPNIHEEILDRLDHDIIEIERMINSSKLEEHLEKLQNQHRVQNGLIEDYKIKIDEMQRDVENIKNIVDALPVSCFRRVELEP